jgi:hypothetical protein
MSELTGNSQASLVSELLEGNTPVFDRLIRLLEAAKEAKGEMVAQFNEDMNAAQAKVEQQLQISMEILDGATPPKHSPSLLEEVEKVQRRAGRTGPRSRPLAASAGVRKRPKPQPSDPRLLTGGSK